MPNMSGARYFAEALGRPGTTRVFFVPTITRAMAEMEDMNITRSACR